MVLDVFRVEFDGLAVAGDGFVQFSLCVQGEAEAVVGPGGFRVEFDGLVIAKGSRKNNFTVLRVSGCSSKREESCAV